MSAPLTRVALTAITRSHQVRCTSLTAAASTQTSSSFKLSLSPVSHLDKDMSTMLFGGATCVPTLDVNRFGVTEPSNIKLSATKMLANISGNGAFIVTDNVQNSVLDVSQGGDIAASVVGSFIDSAASKLEELSIWLISTLKRRKKMMNKHKLRKRRKKLRLKSKK